MMVQIQDPIILDDYSQPEPDVAILRVDPGNISIIILPLSMSI